MPPRVWRLPLLERGFLKVYVASEPTTSPVLCRLAVCSLLNATPYPKLVDVKCLDVLTAARQARPAYLDQTAAAAAPMAVFNLVTLASMKFPSLKEAP